MNNPYDIDSRFWNRQIKSVYERQKGKLKDEDFSKSPEFENLEVLLKICNETSNQARRRPTPPDRRDPAPDRGQGI